MKLYVIRGFEFSNPRAIAVFKNRDAAEKFLANALKVNVESYMTVVDGGIPPRCAKVVKHVHLIKHKGGSYESVSYDWSRI